MRGTGCACIFVVLIRRVSNMICPNCQSEFPDGVKFCSACGTPLIAPVESVVEAVPEVKEEISPVVKAVPEVQEVPTEDMPSASFDPGAPIAMPKQVAEDVPVASEIPSDTPVVAPIEEVLPEYPQTAPVVPEAAPAVQTPNMFEAPVNTAPVAPSTPAAAPVLAPSPIALTPETVPAPVVSANDTSKSFKETTSAGEQKILKTGSAFWLSLLFAIPVIGMIFAIIFAASGKKCQSRKNFAKAALIWHILLIIIALSLVIVCHFLAPDLFDAVINGSAYDVIDELDKIFPFIA